MGKLKIATAGLGNWASSLVQGIFYYANSDYNTSVPGLMHVKFYDYHISDVKVVGAFEVNSKKINILLNRLKILKPNYWLKISF